MATEVTVILRFERPPPSEDEMRELLEEEFDCDVVEYDEWEV